MYKYEQYTTKMLKKKWRLLLTHLNIISRFPKDQIYQNSEVANIIQTIENMKIIKLKIFATLSQI